PAVPRSPCSPVGPGAAGAEPDTPLFFPAEKHLVLLRDGRTLIGYLRSIDQFANLVLHQTVERIHVGKKYGDIPRGIFVVRGENVVLLGEIDLEKESDTPLQQVSIEEILEEQRVEQQAKQESEKLKGARAAPGPPWQAHTAWRGRFHFQIVFSVVLVTVHKSCLWSSSGEGDEEGPAHWECKHLCLGGESLLLGFVCFFLLT
uniref:U6 snRNA-associated Sm-like protein LSm1 n=1 Tax=Junco hyemalis TaxID=40217 RepID=A0A8C5IHC1_JUNHY